MMPSHAADTGSAAWQSSGAWGRWWFSLVVAWYITGASARTSWWPSGGTVAARGGRRRGGGQRLGPNGLGWALARTTSFLLRRHLVLLVLHHTVEEVGGSDPGMVVVASSSAGLMVSRQVGKTRMLVKIVLRLWSQQAMAAPVRRYLIESMITGMLRVLTCVAFSEGNH
jgi:hypothetical protein